MVPADAGANLAGGGFEDPEAGVTVGEVEFFGIAGAVWNVALAIVAEHLAVGVDHHQRVEQSRTVALEQGHGQDSARLARQGSHSRDGRMTVEWAGADIVAFVFVHAEVDAFEQFLQHDKLGTAPCSRADMVFELVEIGLDVVSAGNLDGGRNQLTHGSPIGVVVVV